jgi:putative protease
MKQKIQMKQAPKKPELLAPAGDFISLREAVKAGCDAVYFGIKGFNMRAGAKNFKTSDLPEIKKICGKTKKYLVLNTIIYENELKQAEEIIKKTKKYADAVICWDASIINLCRKYKMPFHISTQASVSNSKSALFYKKLGAERIIPARECTLEQIKEIKHKAGIIVEAFIHGAMCVSVSGRCFMSQFTFGRSANRGECLQNCRREYTIQDIDKEFQLKLGSNYVMSAKDLCTMPFIDKLISAGIDAFKIEGRNRPPEYVKTSVEAYREAIDAYYAGKLTKELKEKLTAKLKKVYNKDFSSGFYMGKPINEFTDEYGNKATTKKEFIGKVQNYYPKAKVVEISVESSTFNKGDTLMIQGTTTGIIEFKAEEIMQDEKMTEQVKRGKATIKLGEKARKNDVVYLICKLLCA